MKIDDSLNGIPALRSRETRKSKTSPPSAAANHGNPGDSVAITQTSAKLSQFETELGQIGAGETGKVEAIRLAIAEGSFRVDEEAVADALVQGTMEQLRRQGKPNR